MTPSEERLLRLENAELREEVALWRAKYEQVPEADTAIQLGHFIKVRKQALRVIAALMARPDKVVTHQALLRVVAPGEETEQDNVLKVAVCNARQALRRSGIAPSIMCSHGVGYSMARETAAQIKKLCRIEE